MSSYRRSSTPSPEIESIANPKSVDDLKIALLNPLSKASQMQRNLEWQRAEHHVFIEKLIQLAVAEQLKVEERERKILMLQQVVDQAEKEKLFNEAQEKYLKEAIKEAEQNKPPTVVIQLTVKELQDKISQQKQNIAVTQQNIQNLTQQISTVGQQKNLLQQAWQNLKQAQVSQYKADLKSQNIPLKTASGKTIDPGSKTFDDLMNEIFKMSPTEFAEKYGKARDQIAKAYANLAQSQPPPIATTPADIMAQKDMPMPTPEPKAAVQEPAETPQATAQPALEKEEPVTSLGEWRALALVAKLAEGETGEKLEKFVADSKPAIAQFFKSLQKAEQDLEAQNAAAAAQDKETPEELKPYMYASSQKKMVELATDLYKQEKRATADLTSEQQKLASQQTQLAHDEKALAQAMSPRPTPE